MRESLPRGYYRELPELARGPLAGYPRVYELAITLISHTEGAHRPRQRRPVRRRVPGGRAAHDRRAVGDAGDAAARADRERAAHGAAHRAAAGRGGGGRPRGRRASMRASERTASCADGAATSSSTLAPPLTPDLRLALPAAAPPRARHVRRRSCWLEQWIARGGAERRGRGRRASTQRLALTQVMMANSITSLRAIAPHGLAARSSSGRASLEAVLREDPPGIYARMTFATRDQYRHVVERIAKRTRRDGGDGRATRRSSSRARRPTERPPIRARAHVGYYLVDDGLRGARARDRLPAAASARRCTAGCCATRTSSSSAASSLGTLARARRACSGSPAPRRDARVARRAAVRAASRRSTSPSAS